MLYSIKLRRLSLIASAKIERIFILCKYLTRKILKNLKKRAIPYSPNGCFGAVLLRYSALNRCVSPCAPPKPGFAGPRPLLPRRSVGGLVPETPRGSPGGPRFSRGFPGVLPRLSRGFPGVFPRLPWGFPEVFPRAVPGSRAPLTPFLSPAGPTPNSGASGRRFRTRQGCGQAYGFYNIIPYK